VHLVVDATISNLDLEDTVVSPGSVPGVDSEPVVDSVHVTPADDLDGVTTKSTSGGVLVDSTLVGEEIFVDGESSSDGTVLGDITLDLVNTAESVAGGSHVLVAGVGDLVVGRARGATNRLDLGDSITLGEGGGRLMVVALGHGVVVTEFAISEISSSDNTLLGEPFPGGSDLTSIASHGLALEEVAAASGVRDRELVGESSIRLNAETIVVSLGSSMSPARTAVGLVANVVDDASALGPVGSGIEDLRSRDGGIGGEVRGLGSLDCPLGVNDSSHDSLGLLLGDVLKLGVDTGSPGGGVVVVNDVDVGLEGEGSLSLEHLHDVNLAFAHVESLASAFSILEVDVGLLSLNGLDSLLDSGELFEDGINSLKVVFASVGHGVLAKLTDVVAFSEELVDLGGRGSSGQ